MLKQTRTTTKTFSLIFKCAPREALLMVVLLACQGIVPALSLSITQNALKWLFDSSNDFPVSLVVCWGVIVLLLTICAPVLSILRVHLHEKFLAYCNVLLMEKANGFESIYPFENQRLYDEIQFLKEEARRKPLHFLYVITSAFKDSISILAVLIVLGTIDWKIPFGLIISSIPHIISTIWLEKQGWDLALFLSPEARKMAKLSSFTLDEISVKEIRLFNIGSFLVNQYIALSKTFQQSFASKHYTIGIKAVFLSFLSLTCNIALFVWIILLAKSKVLALEKLIIAFQSFLLVFKEFSVLSQSIGIFSQSMQFFTKFLEFLKKDRTYSLGFGKFLKEPSFKNGIVFENVYFDYPDGRKALKNINFIIRPNEKIALVGENGAGKSTLIKLLLRFYDPTSGRITIDGIDLREIDPLCWRKKISGVLQDFGKYPFSLRDNIAIGDPGKMHDMSSICLVANKSGMTSLLEKLPHGYDTILCKEFGGTSLSAGEWQKLAMARGLLKNSEILILDEPTASLDPKTECDVFHTFTNASNNKTTLLITHRLGSISMADRIIVLKEGRILEEGTHKNLMNMRSEYYSLYSMQAHQYQGKYSPHEAAER